MKIIESQEAEISVEASFFNSLKEDYPSFVSWWENKVVKENRDMFTLFDETNLVGLTVLKIEKENNLTQNSNDTVLKICTFKVTSSENKTSRGELLLTKILQYAKEKEIKTIYLTVLPKHVKLINFLKTHGFIQAGFKNNELIFSKTLNAGSDYL